MNVNVRHHILTFTIVCSGIFFFGCEAPPTIESKQNEKAQESMQTSLVEGGNKATQLATIHLLKSRLLDAYTLYWPLISSGYQHEQLPAVLSDPLPELRVFGIERVAVLLRDGDATEEELQLVVNHLRDASPSVRLAAAKLLPEISVPGLPEYVANSLAVENDKLVIEEELSFFRTRPNPTAIEPTIALLTFAQVDSAANTLIVLLNSNQISIETKHRIVLTVQRTRRTQDSPALITLEAMLGNLNEQRNLIPLLEHPNDEVRLAVAKGFASSGYALPLIERANNLELYEYALFALQKQVGIESFKQLMALYKPDNESWNIAAFSVAITLNTSSLLRADDMLNRIEKNKLRLKILNSVWENAGDKSFASQKKIAQRAVPLMISTDDAVGALQLLDVFGESLVDEDLLALRFSAAISASAWDAAADARSVPEPWITAWQSTLDSDTTAAAVILQQITLRFEDQLTPQQIKLLGIVQTDATEEQNQ